MKKILEYFSKCKLGRISDGWYEAPHQERDPSRVMEEIYSAIWEEKGGEGSSDLSESGYLLSTHSYLLLPPSPLHLLELIESISVDGGGSE